MSSPVPETGCPGPRKDRRGPGQRCRGDGKTRCPPGKRIPVLGKAFRRARMPAPLWHSGCFITIQVHADRVSMKQSPTRATAPEARSLHPIPAGFRRVSVVIPARNEVPSIWETVRAVKAQALPGIELEILVVDDGSDDGTP
ncbi:MAG TPA: glycosyltransferase, partial [Thermoanaerobaculia bacterium]|nr:glycosyltransferase [Thermoanaerobaculia bacterium]